MGKFIRFFQKKPKIVSLVVVLLGIALAFGIAKKPYSPSASDLFDASLGERSLSTYEQLLKRSPSSGYVAALGENATDKLVQKYGEEFFRLNQDKAGQGLEAIPSLVTPDEMFVDSLLEEGTSGSLAIPLFDVKDIRISTASSAGKDLATYLDSYSDISQKNLKGVDTHFVAAVYEFLEYSDSLHLRAHVSAASAQVQDLLKVEVPEGFSSLHLELLNMWQRRFVLGTVFEQSETDPVRSALALNSLTDAMMREKDVALLFDLLLLN